MEIGVARTDSRNPVLSHQHGRVRIMHYVAGQIRKLSQRLGGNVCVTIAWDEDIEARRGEQRRYEIPGSHDREGSTHHARMCHDTKEFVDDRPCQVPRAGGFSLALQPRSARRVD